MNRAERRAILAKARKKADFAKSLTPLQQEYIDEIVKATREKAQMDMIVYLETVITAALIENTDLNLDEIFNVNVSAGKFMGEIKNIEKSICLEERVMKLKKIEKEVNEKIFDMVTNGLERKDVVKVIREEFKGSGITTAEINVAYKMAKEKYDEMSKCTEDIKQVLGEPDKDIEDALEYIFEGDVEETQNKADTEEKEVGQANISVDIEKANTEENNKAETVVINNNSKLKVRSVEGEHGLYNIGDSVVTIGEFTFGSVEEVNSWASNEREELEKQMNEIKAKINHINSCEAEAAEVIKVYM